MLPLLQRRCLNFSLQLRNNFVFSSSQNQYNPLFISTNVPYLQPQASYRQYFATSPLFSMAQPLLNGIQKKTQKKQQPPPNTSFWSLFKKFTIGTVLLGGVLSIYSYQTATCPDSSLVTTPLDFHDSLTAFHNIPTLSLWSRYLTLKFCGNEFLRTNSIEFYTGLDENSIVRQALNQMIRFTFFKNFVGGESVQGLYETLSTLKQSNIGGALVYAAEDAYNQPTHVLDENCKRIIQLIIHAGQVKRSHKPSISSISSISSSNESIHKIDEPLSQSRESEVPLFSMSSSPLLFGVVKVTCLIDPTILALISNGKSLSVEQENLLNDCLDRLESIFQVAQQQDIPVLVDAETTEVQPAIDDMILQFMRRFNTDRALIYSTYQMYLKQSAENVLRDFEIAKTEGFILGAKIVRGAYLSQEARLAQHYQVENPVFDSIEQTHSSFDSIVAFLIGNMPACNVMVCSHNPDSILKASNLLKFNSEHQDQASFAQLLGMGDFLTYNLSFRGSKVIKYLLYGPVEETIPYLLRRLEENGAMMARSSLECDLIGIELARRLFFLPQKVCPYQHPENY